jgi:PAS domain-containing protein
MTRAALERLVHERYSRLAAAPEIAGWSLDLKTTVVSWSPGIYRILGIPNAGQERPRGIAAKMMTPESAARFEASIAEATALDGASFDLELDIRHDDGFIVPIRVTGVSRHFDGIPAYIAGTMRLARQPQKRQA